MISELSTSGAKDDAPCDLEDLADTDAPSAALLAIRNGLKLGGSLLITWSIALAMRLVVPRYLGPVRFGTLNFAEGFTMALFTVLSLGADSYIRKEIALRPGHASDFFGGTFVLRAAMTLGLFGVIALVMSAAGRTPEVRFVVFLYAAAQFFVTANATLSAMLHAKGHVGGMSVLAIATKIVWAGGVLAALATRADLWAYAASYLASEAVETVVLFLLAQRHLSLLFRVDLLATKAMVIACLPFYIGLFASTAYGKLDVSLIEFMVGTEEVGWYGAASAIAGLTLLVTPLIGWVLMPMFARAFARSREEFNEQIRRSLQLILMVAIPASLMITLGADVWIHLLFGSAFAPAVLALRILACMFVLTYVAIVYSMVLIMERPWALTWISVGGLGVNLLLNLSLIHLGMRLFGRGGAGAASAAAMLGTEIFVSGCMMGVVGRAAFDHRSLVATAKCLAAYGCVTVVHCLLAPLGPLRLGIDGALYLALILVSGALRLPDLLGAATLIIRRRARGLARRSS